MRLVLILLLLSGCEPGATKEELRQALKERDRAIDILATRVEQLSEKK